MMTNLYAQYVKKLIGPFQKLQTLVRKLQKVRLKFTFQISDIIQISFIFSHFRDENLENT